MREFLFFSLPLFIFYMNKEGEEGNEEGKEKGK